MNIIYSVGGIGSVVAQNIQVGGHTWNLKHGPNSNWDVFSFITAEGDITNFNSDLNSFFRTCYSFRCRSILFVHE